MGGGSKLDYTIIGDMVNVAALVEAKTRETGDTILMTEATRRHIPYEDAELDNRGTIPVRGRREPLVLFAIQEPARAAAHLRGGCER